MSAGAGQEQDGGNDEIPKQKREDTYVATVVCLPISAAGDKSVIGTFCQPVDWSVMSLR